MKSVADVIAIQQLKARYAQFADSKYTRAGRRQLRAPLQRAARAQANCFTADAVWDGGKDFGRRLVGRAALFKLFSQGPWQFAMHYYVSPVIEVSADHATGCWRLWQVGIPARSREVVFLMATTQEEYRRERGEWLHSAVRFERIHFVRPRSGAGIEPMPPLGLFTGISTQQ